MTKDKIKKALECCVKHVYCKGCPYRGNQQCIGKTQQDALILITEQEKEIERLKDDYAKLQEQFAQYQIASDKEIKAQVKQAQIDVLNKVKDLMDKYYVFEGVCGYFIDDFKELIKEVENE